MMRSIFIGVDLGTSSTKAALYTLDGTRIAKASVEVPLYHPHQLAEHIGAFLREQI